MKITLNHMAIFTLAAATPMAAQTDDPEEFFELPEFVVQQDSSGYSPLTAFSATRTRTPIGEIPISFDILTADFIKDIGAQTATDALRYSAGVTVSPGGGAGAQGISFKIRGFDTAWMLRDGFPRYQAPNIANTERIEVIKGAASFLYGRSGPGGAINYITKRPLFTKRTEMYAFVGSESYFRGGVDHTDLIGETLSYRVILDAHNSDKWWDDAEDNGHFASIGVTMRPTQHTNWYIGAEFSEREFNTRPGLLMTSDLALNWTGTVKKGDRNFQADVIAANADALGLTDAQRALSGGNLLQSLTQEQRRMVRDDFPVITRYAPELSPRGRKLNLAGAEPMTNWKDYSIFSDFTTRLTDWLDVRNGTLYSYREWTWNWIPNGANNILRTGGNVDPLGPSVEIWAGAPSFAGPGLLSNEVFANQLDFKAEFETDFMELTVLAGAEFWRDTFQNQNQSGEFLVDGVRIPDDQGVVIAYLNDFPRLSAGVNARPDSINVNETRENLAGYFNLQGAFFDQRMRIMAGVRRERSEVTGRWGNWGPDRAPTITKSSPQIGVMLKVIDNVNLYAMRSEDFNPNTFGRTRDGDPLPPPDGKNREIGVKAELFDKRLTIQSAYFEVEQSGRNVVDPEDPTARIAGGAFESSGFEFDIIAQPIANLQIVANYAYIDTKISRIPSADEIIGQRLADVPRHAFSIWTRYDFTDGAVSGAFIGLGARHEGDRMASNNYWNTITNDAYTAFDALIGYRIALARGEATISLNITNIFDKEYVERAEQPSAPRQFLLSARYVF